MLTREVLQEISETRLKEAKLLYANGLYDGAKYILGYSLETAFKARICKVLNTNYPEKGDLRRVFYTHDFDTLIILAGLEREIDEQRYNLPQFGINWSLLTDGKNNASAWKETLRYEKIGSSNQNELKSLFLALEDGEHGVLTWLKNIW